MLWAFIHKPYKVGTALGGVVNTSFSHPLRASPARQYSDSKLSLTIRYVVQSDTAMYQFPMADPELAVLASDIRALSVLLSVADYYWWPSAPRSRTESADSKSFSHISTLVGLSSSIPVAVTGMIAAGEATVTIVCPRTRRLKAQQLPDQDLVESHYIQRNTRTLKEILQG